MGTGAGSSLDNDSPFLLQIIHACNLMKQKAPGKANDLLDLEKERDRARVQIVHLSPLCFFGKEIKRKKERKKEKPHICSPLEVLDRSIHIFQRTLKFGAYAHYAHILY